MTNQNLNFNEDLKWCIDNDFQVYIKPIDNNGNCKIAIRKGGISTDGKSSKYCKEKELTLYSTETLGSITYKSQKIASQNLPKVFLYLRKNYGRI